MHVYHEVDSSVLDSVLIDGLEQGERGDKGDDESIIAADKLLDRFRSSELKSKGLSRADNIYAYIAEANEIVDIASGEMVDLDDFVANSSGAVLRLTVDTERCFVSDLDIYDQIKTLLENNKPDQAEGLVDEYWRSILPLTNFDIGDIDRPEVMITYHVRSEDIEICR